MTQPPGPDTRPALLVTRRLPPDVEGRAARDFDARLNPEDEIWDGPGIARRAEGCEGLLVTAGDRLDAPAIAALPESVRICATFSVGVDHIDLDAARARGLVVTNTPDVLTDATADIAMLALLGAARRASEGERMIRSGGWTGWTPTQLLGTHVSGKRLCILGMGRIGQAMARRARGFDMEIHYSNRSRLPPDLEQGAVWHADPEDLLPLAEFLSFHCPLTEGTRGWLNAERIARMPDGAVVVNTARGPIVDDGALIEALRSGKLAGAGLDVFTGEPRLDSRYKDLPNAFLLPHLGSATVETRNAMGFRALDNLDAFFAGRQPPDRVA